MSPRKELLGEIFVKRRLITHDELQDALRYQEVNKEFLGKILVQRGLITEEQLLIALSEQLDMRIVNLRDFPLDMELADMFSKSLILDHKCFPIKKTPDTIIIAVYNPLDAWIVTEAETQVKDYKIERVLVSSDDMDQILIGYKKHMKNKIRKLFGGGEF